MSLVCTALTWPMWWRAQLDRLWTPAAPALQRFQQALADELGCPTVELLLYGAGRMGLYAWLEQLIAEGRMKTGQRLDTPGATVSRKGVVTDGPFGESKEVVGGYWFILAHSLEEAAQLAAQNPCMRYGLFYEIRPIDPQKGSAYAVTNETPDKG